jgi:hypothetical protein
MDEFLKFLAVFIANSYEFLIYLLMFLFLGGVVFLKDRIVDYFKSNIWSKLKKLFGIHQKLDDNKVFIQDVYDEIVSLRHTMVADRSFILEFSNGEKFSSKNPIFKVSRSYSSIGLGISPDKEISLGVPITLYWDIFQAFFGTSKYDINGVSILKSKTPLCKTECRYNERVYLVDVDNLASSTFKNISIMNGTKYYLISHILNNSGNIIGLLGVEYLSSDIDKDYIQPCIMCKSADIISSIFATCNKG